jgi:hypothetical protein
MTEKQFQQRRQPRSQKVAAFIAALLF